MAHAARASADASRKASLAAANASLTIGSPSSPDAIDVFSYDSDEKNDDVVVANGGETTNRSLTDNIILQVGAASVFDKMRNEKFYTSC